MSHVSGPRFAQFLNMCQYKDIPVRSVAVGRLEDRMTKDRVTLLTKIQKRYRVSLLIIC